jgi:hypothetical protein
MKGDFFRRRKDNMSATKQFMNKKNYQAANNSCECCGLNQ